MQEKHSTFSELLDQFFVLVKLFDFISGHLWGTLGFLFGNVKNIINNVNLFRLFWDVWLFDGLYQRNTCLLVVLQGDLKFDGFQDFLRFSILC